MNMISLFGKPEKVEPSFLEKLKASVTKTKAALSETVDNIFLGEKQIDPAALKQLETALLTADLGVKTTREILDSIWSRVDSLHRLFLAALPEVATSVRRGRCTDNSFEADRL